MYLNFECFVVFIRVAFALIKQRFVTCVKISGGSSNFLIGFQVFSYF